MTLYRYLVKLEREKRITTYQVSYSEISRSNSDGNDEFQVKVQNGHMYKRTFHTSNAVNCKSFFRNSFKAVQSSHLVMTVFRFLFDRVHACSQVQKPHVLSKQALELQANKPLEL